MQSSKCQKRSSPRIIIKPKFLRILGLTYNSMQVLYPFILTPEKIFSDVENSVIKRKYLPLITHEKKHHERISEVGVLKWYVLYLFSSKFRLGEELVAKNHEYHKAKELGLGINIDKDAKALSSWIYLRMTSYENVRSKLRKLLCT